MPQTVRVRVYVRCVLQLGFRFNETCLTSKVRPRVNVTCLTARVRETFFSKLRLELR